MTLLSNFRPHAPIPTAEINPVGLCHHHQIRPVVLHIGPDASRFETASSVVFFARIRAAATLRERISFFSCDGLEADGESLAALNCYLRTAKAMGRMKLPFDRIFGRENSGTHSRHDFASFVEHVGIRFL
jgi:hypothetical protein